MFDLDFRQERELKFSLSNSYSLAFSRKTFEEGEFYIFNLFFSFFYNFTTVVSFTGHISASFFLYKFQIQKDKCENNNFTNFFFLSYKIYSHFLYFIFDNLNN